MSKILLQIDGREVEASKGATILEVAKSAGIFIPTLCHNEELVPYGVCRICVVEIEIRDRTNLVASCNHRVEQDLVIRTRSDKVDKTRKILIEQFLAHAPDAPLLQELAQEYGPDRPFPEDRFFDIVVGMTHPELGDFSAPDWQFTNQLSPEELVALAATWVQGGARLLGGCCGTTPSHIRALRDAGSDLRHTSSGAPVGRISPG